MAPTLTFLGAARTVTGSKHLLRHNRDSVLVDCGLFQGHKNLRLRNWEPFPEREAHVDAVLLTHAHIDHTGYLPRLVRQGFRGAVIASRATCDLARVLLRDAAHLQEEEARYANKKGYSRHTPAQPLYTTDDAETALTLLHEAAFDEEIPVADGTTVRFRPAGHILGASWLTVRADGRTTIFSGDLGRATDAIMKRPAPIDAPADYVLTECTYGDRRHEEESVEDQLTRVLSPALERGAVVVIPAFAVGRSTLLIHHIGRLERMGRIPVVPVYLDSPMAVEATRLYQRFQDDGTMHDAAIDCAKLNFSRTVDQSKAINDERGPAVIISGSGMATGGRVTHHLARRLPDRRNLVLLVGYQAPGTRGARLRDGERRIKIHGDWVPVEAEVREIHGLSAHADADGILDWLRTLEGAPRRAILVHGEPDSLEHMRGRVAGELGWPVHIPDHGETIEL